MNRDTIRDYLQRAQMDHDQAEALSRVFDEMATKRDVARLEDRFKSLEERIELRFEALGEKFAKELAQRDAQLTWKMIAIVGFFATASTVLNLFAA